MTKDVTHSAQPGGRSCVFEWTCWGFCFFNLRLVFWDELLGLGLWNVIYLSFMEFTTFLFFKSVLDLLPTPKLLSLKLKPFRSKVWGLGLRD